MSGSAIPASQIVNVVPSVLNAGGIGLDLLGLLVTWDDHIPMDTVYSFPDLTSVQSFFGPTSYVAMLAGTYFLADINATKRPGALLMAQWSGGGRHREAWLRSAQLPGLTLAQLQATTPNSTFTLMMDGATITTQPITLSGATSFSQAAQIIGGAIPYYNKPNTLTATARVSDYTMTVSSHGTSGAQILPGMIVMGAGIPAGTWITSGVSTTDNWLTGVYTLNRSLNLPTDRNIITYQNCCSWDASTFQFKIQTAAYGDNQAVVSTYVPSISHLTAIAGNLANVIALTQASGARIQPIGTGNVGSAHRIDSPASYMDRILTLTQNWASFTTDFEPNTAGGYGRLAFASWTNLQRNNYLYACWDTDVTPTVSPNAQTSLGNVLNRNRTSGTVPIYSPTLNNGRNLAMFTMGAIAAIDFDRLDGRKTMAFRGQTGIVPDISSGLIAGNLEANFYNYYGIWTTANDLFRFLYPGLVSGPYRWIDSYINQIWMNNGFQLALMELLTQSGSIPYNQFGYTLIKAACQDVINRAMNFGAIRTGIQLSEVQKVEVNTMAGLPIDRVLTSTGYYLQIQDADPQVRVDRGTPPMTFWYTDGGSIQRLSLASVMVQ